MKRTRTSTHRRRKPFLSTWHDLEGLEPRLLLSGGPQTVRISMGLGGVESPLQLAVHLAVPLEYVIESIVATPVVMARYVTV